MRFLACPDEIRLEGYFYGDLSPWEETVIKLHVSTCKHCRAKIAELKEFNASLRSLPVEEPPAGFEDDLIRMVKSWDFDPDPVPIPLEDDQPQEGIQIQWNYKVRWAVGSLVFLAGTVLQYKYGSLLPRVFGRGANLLSSIQDLGALWRYLVSGEWLDGVASVVAAIRTDGFASLGILRNALPSGALSVLVFGGITAVLYVNQLKASRNRGEGYE